MHRSTSLALAAVIVLSACASSSSNDQSSSHEKSKTTTPTGLSANNPGCQYIVASEQKRITRVAPDLPTEYLTSAVAEPFTCYDKVTFTFDKGDGPGLPPAYHVEYRKKPFGLIDPDGKPTATTTGGFKEAKYVLYVEMTPTSTQDQRTGKHLKNPTYAGNLRLLLPKEIKHVVIVEWIQTLPESKPPVSTTTTLAGAVPKPVVQRVVWLIGLDAKRPFTVDYASQPVPHVSVYVMR
jgi:hypothetical protein